MTVRELIRELFKYDMDKEIFVATDKKSVNESGDILSGYRFDIDTIKTFADDVEIIFTDYRKDDKNISYDESIVSTWIDKAMNDNKNIHEVIEEAKVTISNERLWAKGCDKLEEIQIHEQNIANLEEYMIRLHNMI